jgi:hypothetical protein
MESEIMVVFSGNPVDAEMISEILNDNNIVATIKNQLMGSIAPWQVAAGGFEPTEVEILLKDKEQALQLIEAFHQSK